jgi:putative colanic acid biosynthesis UDP-glucose lipid carrier transferase
MPVIAICETPFMGLNSTIKRASDVVLSALILLLLAPLMAVVAAAVKMSSSGPAIFRQRRYGLYGEEIIVYKFRSMIVMENGPAVVQAQHNDGRLTSIGGFLRRTSLDELPQFINVLQGRMSIVGPRPHAIAHNEQYRKLVKGYMLRHKVRPGITGWAQVNGMRGETETVDKMMMRIEYDLEYLRHWSLKLDLQIIWRTIFVVLGKQNAY